MSSSSRHSNGGIGGRGAETSSSSSSSRTAARQPIRRNAAFDDEDEDISQLHNGHRGRADEVLVGYSRAGAEMKHKQRREKVAPLMIAKQGDSNWMEERKRRLGLDRYRKELGSLSGGMGGGGTNGSSMSAAAAAPTTDRIGHEEQHVGLQLRRTTGDEEVGDADDMGMAGADADTPPTSQAAPSPPPPQPIDDDAAARAALLLGRDGRDANAAHDHAVIAPAQPLTEEEALQRDMDARPDEPTLDDYAKMPVEAFGAALLRGMGWREGMGAGKQRQGPTTAPDVKKRAALLGLGAKERQLDAAGTSSDAARRTPGGAQPQAHRPERRYVPVMRRVGERSEHSSPFPSARHRDRSRSPPARDDRREHGKDRRDRHRDHSERHRYTDDHRETSRREESDRDRPSRHRDDEQGARRHYRSHDERHRDDRRDRRARD